MKKNKKGTRRHNNGDGSIMYAVTEAHHVIRNIYMSADHWAKDFTYISRSPHSHPLVDTIIIPVLKISK